MAGRRRNAHPEDIKAAVRKKAGTMIELANRHGVSHSLIHAAIIRPQPSGNRIIADFLGKSVHELWPEWFDEDGNRRLSTPKPSRRRTTSQCQKREAA